MPNPHTLDVDALINILYRVVYYVLDQHFLYIILHRAFANIFYVIFIPKGRAKAAVGGQFVSWINVDFVKKTTALFSCRIFQNGANSWPWA